MTCSTRNIVVQITDRPRPSRPKRETEPSQMDVAEYEGVLARLEVEDIDDAIESLQAKRKVFQQVLDTVEEIIHYRA